MTNTLTNTMTNTYVVIFLSVSIFGRGYHSRYQNFELTDVHQGNDLFSVYSRGRQCAFMCLSALLTARNNPVVVWSKTTLNNVLLQGDSMYLEVLNNGLIVLDPGVDLLSMNNLPSAVYVGKDTC